MEPSVPTGGNEREAPPASHTGGTPAPPAGGQASAPQSDESTSREAMIPRERFDEVKAKADELEAKLAELQARAEAPSRTEAPKTWAEVPDETLNSIVANPLKYPEHFAAALAERDRRMELRIVDKATSALTVQQLQLKEAEAFNPATPLGREVKRILAAGRTDAEYLQDAIELARYRLTGVKPSQGTTPSQLAANLANALQTPPGGTKPDSPPPPNWADMSRDEFEKRREAVLLGRGA